MMSWSGKSLLICIGGLASCMADARTWRNDVGAELEGELLLVREKDIILKLSDGRKVSVPVKVLSGEDMGYVREWEQSGKNVEVAVDDIREKEFLGGKEAENNGEKAGIIWPEKVSIPNKFLLKTIQESANFSVYESNQFHFEASKILRENEKTHLSSTFEGALQVLSELPLELPLARQKENIYFVQVFFSEDDYLKAGGRPRTRVSMSPLRLLVYLKRNSRGKSVDLNEVKPIGVMTQWVSQFVGDIYWLGEGFSEYMRILPFSGNTYDFSNWSKLVSSIPRTIRRKHLSLPPLGQLMAYRGVPPEGKNVRNHTRMKYGALLTFVYFLRMDGEGKGERIKKYMDALQEGKDNPIEFLLDNRSWQDVEKDMIREWKKHKVFLHIETPVKK